MGTRQQLPTTKNLEGGGSRTLWFVYGMWKTLSFSKMTLLRALIIESNLTSSSPFVRNISTATRTIIKEHVKKEVSAPTPTCASTVLGNIPANTVLNPGALALNCSIQKTTTVKQRPSKASNNSEIETPIKVAPFFQYMQGYKPNLIKFLTKDLLLDLKSLTLDNVPFGFYRIYHQSREMNRFCTKESTKNFVQIAFVVHSLNPRLQIFKYLI